MSAVIRAQSRIRGWRESPSRFVYENFRVDPDRWQQKGLEYLASPHPDDRRIGFSACAGPGKTAELAWAGWWLLSCWGEKGEHPKGAATSITADNLKDNLWAELAKWQDRSEFLTTAFKWTKKRIFAVDHPKTWFLAFRAFSKSADEEAQGRTLSGLHSPYIFYLIDESGDIPPSVLRAAEQGLSTRPKFAKILQAGNPTSHAGMLYAVVTTLAEQWRIIRISGDPDDPDRSPRIDISWAREQILTYGRDNPWVMAYILGLFPPAAINTLLSPDEVAAAMGRRIHPDDYAHVQKRLGVDVARFGDDRIVIFPRQGLQAFNPAVMRNADGPTIAARIATAKYKWGSELEFVDDTGGFGSTVIDSLRLAGITPMAINSSNTALDHRYYNIRSECWFKMAEWVKRGGALPNRPGLKKELVTPVYYFHKGQLRLEEKDQIKKRLKFSPDEADALSETFALPDMPAAFTIAGQKMGRTQLQTEWNPFKVTGRR